jgi:hypothetical protein
MLGNELDLEFHGSGEAICRVTTSTLSNAQKGSCFCLCKYFVLQLVENAEVDLFLFHVDENDPCGLDYYYSLQLMKKLYPFKKEFGLRTIDRKIS